MIHEIFREKYYMYMYSKISLYTANGFWVQNTSGTQHLVLSQPTSEHSASLLLKGR